MGLINYLGNSRPIQSLALTTALCIPLSGCNGSKESKGPPKINQSANEKLARTSKQDLEKLIKEAANSDKDSETLLAELNIPMLAYTSDHLFFEDKPKDRKDFIGKVVRLINKSEDVAQMIRKHLDKKPALQFLLLRTLTLALNSKAYNKAIQTESNGVPDSYNLTSLTTETGFLPNSAFVDDMVKPQGSKVDTETDEFTSVDTLMTTVRLDPEDFKLFIPVSKTELKISDYPGLIKLFGDQEGFDAQQTVAGFTTNTPSFLVRGLYVEEIQTPTINTFHIDNSLDTQLNEDTIRREVESNELTHYWLDRLGLDKTEQQFLSDVVSAEENPTGSFYSALTQSEKSLAICTKIINDYYGDKEAFATFLRVLNLDAKTAEKGELTKVMLMSHKVTSKINGINEGDPKYDFDNFLDYLKKSLMQEGRALIKKNQP